MRTYRRLSVVVVMTGLLLGGGSRLRPERQAAPGALPAPSSTAVEQSAPETSPTLADEPVGDPNTEAPSRPTPAGLKPMGTIEIPKIGLRHDFFEGIDLKVVAAGPGHWPGTAMPGWPGNAVFAGHRVTNTKPFRNIDQLGDGDLVHFTYNGQRSTYRVTGHLIVKPTDVWIVDQTRDATATLFACHPPGSAAERYVVRLAMVR